MLKRYAYGIINHCLYPIHTGKVEGINNKIKVIKRKAYGFLDLEYFTLKVKYATLFLIYQKNNCYMWFIIKELKWVSQHCMKN